MHFRVAEVQPTRRGHQMLSFHLRCCDCQGVVPQRHLTEGAAGKFRFIKLHYPTGSEHQAFAVGQHLDNHTTLTLSSAFYLSYLIAQNQPINNVIFHYIKKHCKNSCLNCVNIVKYIRLSGRKLAKCKNISNLART